MTKNKLNSEGNTAELASSWRSGEDSHCSWIEQVSNLDMLKTEVGLEERRSLVGDDVMQPDSQ